MLGAVSVEKVEAKLYNILYVDGLEDVPEAHLKKHTGLTRQEIADFLARFYVRKDGFYHLKTNQTENIIRLFRSSQVLNDSSAERSGNTKADF